MEKSQPRSTLVVAIAATLAAVFFGTACAKAGLENNITKHKVSELTKYLTLTSGSSCGGGGPGG
jgi:hypothetical protein